MSEIPDILKAHEMAYGSLIELYFTEYQELFKNNLEALELKRELEVKHE